MLEQELIDWWFSRLDHSKFTIQHHGSLNKGEGPDILDAVIKVNNVLYRGAVEFDCASILWFQHGHFQHPLYQHVLLHIFNTGQTNYHGYQPTFSYNREKNELIINKVEYSFLYRRRSLLQFYLLRYSIDQVFLLFFIRTLGYYKNREVMTWLGIQLLEQTYNPKQIFHHFKKVRPNNRFEKRKKQALMLIKRPFLFQQFKQIISKRLPLSPLLSELHELTNREVADNEKIGKDRIKLFLFNWTLLLLLLENGVQAPFGIYLDSLFQKITKEASIKKVHSESDLKIKLSDIIYTR